MRFADLANKKVAIWGYGLEGRVVKQRCDQLGYTTTIVETNAESGSESGVVYGEQAREALHAAEVIIKSPGVPATSDLYVELVHAHKTITSLTDLWLSDNAARTIAVTGTKGKSTTASLIHHLLVHAGVHARLAGNIGVSLLDESDPPAEVVVTELSSYQAQSLTCSPRIVALTSLFPEHLTWHGSVEQYYADKLHVAAYAPEHVIAADAELAKMAKQYVPEHVEIAHADALVRMHANGDIELPGGYILAADELPLRGAHNARNIALAIYTVHAYGVTDMHVLAEAVRAFKPLSHRMEEVRSTDDKIWIDDSLATIPQAVVASLQTLSDRSVAVLLGGQDRGVDYAPLVEYLQKTPGASPLFVGPAGRRMFDQLGSGTYFATFEEALKFARTITHAEVVLLSPAAPSYDEFTDYRERSALFRRYAA